MAHFNMTPFMGQCLFALFINKFELGEGMPPIWPFGKKKEPLSLEEEAPAPVIYKKTADVGIESTSTDQQHADYKAALSFFGNGQDTVKKAEEQSQHYDGISGTQSNSAEPTTVAPPPFNWVHHTDGYHYKRLDDGTFDPVAHVKNDDGTYQPYS
jgi:hypothetical protein